MTTLKIGDSLDDIYHMYCLQSLPLHGGRFTEFIAIKNVQARRKHHYSPSCLTSLNGANFRDKRSFICMHLKDKARDVFLTYYLVGSID